MGNRVVYGRSFSSNGWPMVDQNSCTWVKVPGTSVSLQIQNGWPLQILRAFAADFNAYVEPLRDPDSACWTATNSVSTSNHLSGTAMDLNWNTHPFQVANAGFNATQIATIRELQAFYEGTVFWGNDWSSPKDAMHFQLASLANGGNINTYNNPRVADFIARKIRADGFSTFRRGGTTTPPPAPNAADILARAADIPVAKAAAIFSQVSFALGKANCTNPRRIAAALAQWVIESGHFVYTEEIASGPETEERWKYKGRTWIQLTWLDNYRGFGQWCHQQGLVDDPEVFVKNPKSLADQKWAALGPAYWWAAKYPRINEYADRGDIDNVSKWVNAPAWVDNPNKHANGEKERRDVYNRALALGDQLLALTSSVEGEDELSAEAERKIAELYDAFIPPVASLSPLRPLNAGSPGNVAKLVRYTDSSVHVVLSKLLLALEHPETVATVNELAAANPLQYPDRAKDIKLAQVLLKAVASETQKPAPPAVNTVAPADNSQALSDAYTEIARLQAENAALRAQAQPSTALATVQPAEPSEPATTSGDFAAKVVDSLEGWTERVLSMDVKQRASLTKSLEALQLPNGTQP